MITRVDDQQPIRLWLRRILCAGDKTFRLVCAHYLFEEKAMPKFDEYCRKYSCIDMKRMKGILQMTLHTDGGPLQWGLKPQGELVQAFTDVGADRENRLIILTGTGNEFSGP